MTGHTKHGCRGVVTTGIQGRENGSRMTPHREGLTRADLGLPAQPFPPGIIVRHADGAAISTQQAVHAMTMFAAAFLMAGLGERLCDQAELLLEGLPIVAPLPFGPRLSWVGMDMVERCRRSAASCQLGELLDPLLRAQGNQSTSIARP